MILCDWCGKQILGDDVPDRETLDSDGPGRYDLHAECYDPAVEYSERLDGIDVPDERLGRLVRTIQEMR